MHIIRVCLALLSFGLAFSAGAQSVLSRVTFPLDDRQTVHTLAVAGLDLTHGHSKPGVSFTTEVQDFQLARLDELGIRYHVDIADISLHRNAKEEHAHSQSRGLDCQDRIYDYTIPLNFEPGQVGGFFSLPEVLDHLDAMAILYPHLVSVRRPIGQIRTWQNNSIFYVKISDNPNVDETEPKVLYTGLHHAREFISVSQMIYYMWYLLENYEKDPLIRQVINQTELVFVPVLNPDGLNYNAAGYDPAGDKFTRNHRKNMRDNNENGTFDHDFDGVDLNRNYGHAWGYDNQGSSGYEGSDTYRGPAPFSEPETQAVELLCDTYDFSIALNFHSYGNCLVHPWGFNDQPTSDSIAFSNYGELLTRSNRFIYGRGIETVGYLTNGDADDWMYGEKNIMSMTPEVGDPDDGFYPPKSRIIPLCQAMLELNILAARLVNSLVLVTDESPDFIKPGQNTLNLNFTRYGLIEGEIVVSFRSLSPYILEVPSPLHLTLDKFGQESHALSVSIDPLIPKGAATQIEVTIQQGGYTFKDTLSRIRADFQSIVIDDGDMSSWNTVEGPLWNTTTESFKTGPVSVTDSPGSTYSAASREIILLDQEVDLAGFTNAYAQFWARWDIEDFYDYVVFQASADGKNWKNLCGEHSGLGSVFQAYNEPLYDGRQAHWVLEKADLSDFLGQTIQLRFMLISDGFEQKDGFYFDNFRIITVTQETVSTGDVTSSAVRVFPNPAADFFTVRWDETALMPSLTVYDALGRQHYAARQLHNGSHRIATSGWPEGLYYYQLHTGNELPEGGVISILR